MVSMFIATVIFIYMAALLLKKKQKDILIMLVYLYLGNNKYKHKSQYYLKINLYYHIPLNPALKYLKFLQF